jgi:ketosteroid isomerase-like protein
MADKSLKVRCTTVFSDAGKTMTGKWEYSSDGSKWQTFWDVRATKAK